MGDGTKENPYTREDVINLIEQNDGKTVCLDLSCKEFVEGIDLSNLDLRGIILNRTTLKGAHFEGANLVSANLDSVLIGAHFERAVLVFAHFEHAVLWSAHLEGADLSGARLEGADLKDAKLEGVTLGDFKFTDTKVEDADWGNFVLGEEKSRRFHSAAQTYRRLKQWYTNAGMYDIAGKFFYREMEAKRKAKSWKREPASKLGSWIIRLLCGYGEKDGNIVVAALVMIFSLAVAYVYGGLNLAYAIYFSAVSFTALGYGGWVNITPVGWVRTLGVIESFLGIFMMALFLVTFTRKMTR